MLSNVLGVHLKVSATVLDVPLCFMLCLTDSSQIALTPLFVAQICPFYLQEMTS